MKNVFKSLAMMGVIAGAMWAQQAAAPAAGQPSEAEIKDVQAVQQTQDPDKRMQLATEFVTKYPSSNLRGYVLTMGGEAAQAKRDSARARFFYERAIQADPNSDYAMIMLGAEIAQNTGENDLDKKTKLAQAEKYAKDGMALIEKRTKQPQETQEQFDQQKKEDISRAHMTLGLVAMADQRNEEAGKEFMLAAETDAMNLIRAGMAYNNARKIDLANAALDKFLSIPQLPDQYKKIAEDEKKRGQQLKNAK